VSGLGLKSGLLVDESKFFCSVSGTMHIILYTLLEDGNGGEGGGGHVPLGLKRRRRRVTRSGRCCEYRSTLTNIYIHQPWQMKK